MREIGAELKFINVGPSIPGDSLKVVLKEVEGKSVNVFRVPEGGVTPW